MKRQASVLVVEDDLYWQSLFTETLQAEAVEVRLASDYEEAIAQVERHKFDLAVIDISLTPGDGGNIDGLRVVDRLSTLGADTPVILVTAYSTVDIVKDALSRYAILGVMRKEEWDWPQFLSLTRHALGGTTKTESIPNGEQGRAETPIARRTTPSTGCRVLVVEDDQNWSKLLEEYLREEGHAVETAATYLQATAMVEQVRYDLAVVDFELAGSDKPANVDGYDLLAHLRRSALPVIVVTGLGKRARPLVVDALQEHEVCSCFDKTDFSWPQFGDAVYDAVRAGEWFADVDSLTRRERQLYDCIRRGLTADEDIAAELGIAPKSARNLVSQVLRKLRVPSRAALVAYAHGRYGDHERA